MRNLIKYLGTSHRPNEYDYPMLEYKSCKDKIEFVCKKHGSFIQRVDHHKSGSGCSKCANQRIAYARAGTLQEFIDKSNEIHCNKYDYSNSVYIDYYTKLSIICPIHGSFKQSPQGHHRSGGCTLCGRVSMALNNTKSQEDFVNEAIKVHGCRYSYDLFEYTHVHSNSIVVCKIHGKFSQQAHTHLQGSGCPSCAIGGFKKNKSGILYILSFKTTPNVYKIGITNRDVHARYSLAELSRVNIEREYHFDDGFKCYEIEKYILRTFSRYKYTKERLLDSGNSELIEFNILPVTDKKCSHHRRVCQSWEE